MEIIYKSPSDLKPFQKNPYKHPEKQLNMLKKSMREFGFTSPILVAQNDMILAGHARLEAANQLGLQEVPTIFIDLPYEKAVAYVLADNQLAKLAEEDRDLLAELLQEVSEIPDFDFEATGFELGDLDELLNSEPVEVVDDEFNEDEIIIETDIKKGDLIEIGNHLLLCGDATQKQEIDSLVSEYPISMVFTDPPYDLPIESVLKSFSVTTSYADLQFWMASDKQQIELIYNNFDKFTHFFIHDFKCATLISNSQPMQRHNLISKFGNRKMNNLQDGFTTIVQVATERTSEAHKIFRMGKRIELPAQFISHYSQLGEYILDVFGGSGSTLMACEQLGRKCLINELEPERCELIKRRFEQYQQGKVI